MWPSALRLATTVVLARILGQEAFGLVALAGAAMLALSAPCELGLGQALVQRDDRGEEDLARAADTAFALAFGIKLLLFVVAWALTPFVVAQFERVEGLEGVLRAMLVLYLIDGLACTPAALIEKRWDLVSASGARWLAALTYSAAAIGLAAIGQGVWSLVWGLLISRGLQATWLVHRSGWRPRLRLHVGTARELLLVGRRTWADAAMGAIGAAADKLVIGRVAGSASLGAYSVAYGVCTTPTAPERPWIAGLVRAQPGAQRDVSARSYARAVATIALVSVPVAAGLVALADEFVVTLFGRGWQEMVPLLRVLALYGLATTLGGIATAVLLARGESRVLTLVTAARLTGIIGLLFALGGRGAPAVAWALSLPTLAAAGVGLWLAARRVDCPTMDLLGPLVRTGLATGAMLAPVLAVEAALDPWHPAARLAACLLTGLAAYLPATLAMNRAAFDDLRRR